MSPKKRWRKHRQEVRGREKQGKSSRKLSGKGDGSRHIKMT
jgi:hypothetical protein